MSIATKISDGKYDTGSDDLLAGAVVTLTKSDHTTMTFTTGSDGKYTFSNLPAGTYTLAVTTSASGHYLETSHGTVSIPATAISVVVSAGQNVTGPNFAELQNGGLSGFVWNDTNNDGKIDFDEVGIVNVTVKLTGTDIFGHSVSLSDVTDIDGEYSFTNLVPGSYALTEVSPSGQDFSNAPDSVGSLGGSSNCSTATCYVGYECSKVNNGCYSQCYGGYNSGCFTGYAYNCYNQSNNSCQTTQCGSAADVFCKIPVGGCGDFGVDYNFGEKGKAVSCSSSTASITFWHGSNGQALLSSLNGGPTKTSLGQWLATNFPNLYGTGAAVNFSQMTNIQVAGFFNANDYNVSGVNINAQVLAAAFNAYVTNQTWAGGTYATKYGFSVDSFGVGYQTTSVGNNGAAFGVANNSTMSILSAIQEVDDHVINGVLYGGNSSLITEAYNVFNSINTVGKVD